MKVLVTAASRQGATSAIAEAVGRMFVIGSAIYAGHRLDPETTFLRRFAPILVRRPIWLFSSGPVGDPRRKLVQKMTADPVELRGLPTPTKAREHRILAGKLAGKTLPGPQRPSLLIFRGIEGDWRDWPTIEHWAQAIADSLAGHRAATTVG